MAEQRSLGDKCICTCHPTIVLGRDGAYGNIPFGLTVLLRTFFTPDCRRPARGRELVHHSDRGTTSTALAFQALLRQAGITCSKGRPGTCLDNAVAETFFETLKVELIHRRPWPSRSDVVQAIFAAVETRYNPHRRHGSLGYLSPVAFEASQPSAPSAPKPMTVRQMGAGPTVAWPGGAIPPVSVAGTGVGRGGCRTREAIGPREGRAPVPGHQAAVWPYGGAVLGVWRRTVRPW